MNKKKILLVEDEEHLLKTIQLNLEMENYAVTTAITGYEALKEFRKDSFDLIILDVMLPEMNGFDVCEEIRKENTVIIIAHRFSMVKDADHVVVLDDGKVAEEGTPEMLIKNGGWFAEFANAGDEEENEEVPDEENELEDEDEEE